MNNELLIVQENELFGLITVTGDVLVPTKYRRVMTVDRDLLQFETSDELDYFDVSKRKVISLLQENE